MFKILAFFIEIIYWIQICISPLILTAFLSLGILSKYPNMYALGICILLGIISLFFGIKWANSVWRKRGTSYFVSRASASEDLDKIKKNQL